MSWIRKDSPPDTIRVTIVIKKADYPELADFVWRMPWGQGSSKIRDILSKAVKLSMGKKVEEPAPAKQQAAIPAAAPAVSSTPAAPAFTYIEPDRQRTGMDDETIVQNTAHIVGEIASKY